MRCSNFVPACVALFLVASSAAAQIVDSEPDDYQAPPIERRGGFVLGLSAGGGFGSVRGYPNELGEIGNPDFLRSVEGFSVTNSILIGGGLRDWLTFGVLLAVSGGSGGEFSAANQAIGFRLEGFPLYSFGNAWKDFGILGSFGAGGALVTDESDETVADGGIMSVIGFGAFYEPWRFWQFSAGPQIDYTYQSSESLRSHMATVGLRLAFYGEQP